MHYRNVRCNYYRLLCLYKYHYTYVLSLILKFTVPVTHVIIFLGNSWRAAVLTPCRPQAALKLDDLVRRTSTYQKRTLMLDNIFSINNFILSSLVNSTTIRLTSPLSYFSSYAHFKIFIRPVVAVNSHIFHCSPFTQETGTTSCSVSGVTVRHVQ